MVQPEGVPVTSLGKERSTKPLAGIFTEGVKTRVIVAGEALA